MDDALQNHRKRNRDFLDNTIPALAKRVKNAIDQIELLKSELRSITNELILVHQRGDVSQSSQNGTGSLLHNSKKDSFDFTREDDFVVVYTDGACENNGKANAKAGIGVWFGSNHPLNISKPVDGRPTNNTAEIQACVHAIKTAHLNGITKLKIKTDSQFVINSITKWIHNWKINNWKVASGGAVKNKEDFIVLDNTIKLLEKVVWEHVDGHKGILGNEEADKLACAGATHYK